MRALLAEKFGKEYALAATENSEGKVAQRVLDKLKVEPPKRELVDGYLSAIAEAYGVQWPRKAKGEEEDEDEDDEDDDDPSGGRKVRALEAPLEAEDLSRATPPRDIGGGPKSPVSVVPPSPRTDNVAPKIKLPGPPELKPSNKMKKSTEVNGVAPAAKKDGPGGKIPDVDELAKRFAQLKR